MRKYCAIVACLLVPTILYAGSFGTNWRRSDWKFDLSNKGGPCPQEDRIPIMTATPSSFVFGNISTTKTRHTTIAITNTGKGYLSGIEASMLTGTACAVSSVSSTTAPATIDVACTPTVVGAFSDTLNVRCDQFATALGVAVSGTGVLPPSTFIVSNDLATGARPVDSTGITWTPTGTPNYTAAGLLSYPYSIATATTPTAIKVTFPVQSDVWIGVVWKSPASIGSGTILIFGNTSYFGSIYMLGGTPAKMGIRTMNSASTAYPATADVAAASTYYIKIHHSQATNATTVQHSVNGTTWIDSTTQTGGTDLGGVSYLQLGSSANAGNWNAIRISGTDFNF